MLNASQRDTFPTSRRKQHSQTAAGHAISAVGTRLAKSRSRRSAQQRQLQHCRRKGQTESQARHCWSNSNSHLQSMGGPKMPRNGRRMHSGWLRQVQLRASDNKDRETGRGVLRVSRCVRRGASARLSRLRSTRHEQSGRLPSKRRHVPVGRARRRDSIANAGSRNADDGAAGTSVGGAGTYARGDDANVNARGWGVPGVDAAGWCPLPHAWQGMRV